MPNLPGFYAAGAVLASALGCGLMMGIERERRKGEGQNRALAGVRSFTLVALAGAAAALSGVQALLVVGAVLVAALTVVAYARADKDDPGVTTEIALWLAYLVGAMCATDRMVAAGLAVAVTALLALRAPLHQFSSQWLQPGEVRSALLLAALALLVFPLVPNRPLWEGVLNPHLVLRLVLVLLLIQSLAHVGRRLMQARHAVALSALASGFVSSTATIASLGLAVRANKATARVQAGGAVLSCVATMMQVLVVAATVQPQWLPRLALPSVAGACVAGAWGWWLLRAPAVGAGMGTGGAQVGAGGAAHATAPQAPPASAPTALAPDTPMFKLRDAAMIAGLLTGIQVGVQWLTQWLGDVGMLVGVLLASLADVHGAAAAVLVRAAPGAVGAPGVEHALMAALCVHAVSKCAVSWFSGGAPYARVVAPGVLAHTAAFVGVLALL